MNFPELFIQRMHRQLGEETESFFAAMQIPSPTSIRLHHLKGRTSFELSEKVKWCDTGYYLDQRPSFHLDPHWHGGAYYVQEASSMILDEVLRQIPLFDQKKIWLDLCAAPGGKTGILAKHLGAGDVLIANEVISQRRSILYENLVKAGYLNTFITGTNSSSFPIDFADVLLIDAPCSGEGMMRKDPEAIQQWSDRLVHSCSILQQQLISDAVKILKPGGWLIYSTCSYSHDENMGNAMRLVNQYELENFQLQFPEEWNIVTLPENDIVGYQLYPHRVKGEGLFIAVFQKKEDDKDDFTKSKKRKSRFTEIPNTFHGYLNSPEKFLFENLDNNFTFTTQEAAEKADEVRSRLPSAQLICELGELKGKDFIPAHFLAMSELSGEEFPRLALSKDQSLDFLEKKSLHYPEEKNGWYIVEHDSTSLGWAKRTSQGWKNHYPMSWRLRQRS